MTPSLTLNLGVRWEFYQVPYDGLGRGQALVGGSNGVFGVSGTNFNSLFQPGVLNGSLTQLQLIGPGTQHPDLAISTPTTSTISDPRSASPGRFRKVAGRG